MDGQGTARKGANVNCIVTISNTTMDEYLSIVKDLTRQFEDRGITLPFFVHLPHQSAEINVVWVDEEIEKDHYAKILSKYGHA